MSSLRNAVNRRVHRERAQPLERSKFGLLEKHKDYSKRAKDHNKKKAQLKSLREKARDRNEDEFYYGMLSRSGPGSKLTRGAKKGWTGTVDGDRGNASLDVETVRLLKTQDMGYLRTVRNLANKEVRELEERILALGGSLDGVAGEEEDEDDDVDDDVWEGLDGFDDEEMMGPTTTEKKTTTKAAKPKKIVFADGADDRDEKVLEAEETAAAADEMALDDGDDAGKQDPEKLRAFQKQRALERTTRRLEAARRKLRALARAENELELQRARMAKTATSGGVTKKGQKIKIRERKR